MGSDITGSSRRVSLTKADLATDAGRHLVDLLLEIGDDGRVTEDELEPLRDSLMDMPREIAGVRHLLATLEEVMEDGIVTEDELAVLFRQVQRVLPATERAMIEESRKAASREDRERARAERIAKANAEASSWRNDPATDAQAQYVEALGGSLSPGATKGQASDLITALKESGATPREEPPTPRQRMVLRFWDVETARQWTKPLVIQWMDSFYEEDPARRDAWEMFKSLSGDEGQATVPDRVPVGAGYKYLSAVKTGKSAKDVTSSELATRSIPRKKQADGAAGCGCLIILAVTAYIVISAITKK